MAEIAIVKLLRMPKKLNVLRSLNILFIDEIGQVSAELLSVLDIILRRIRDSNIFMGGVIDYCYNGSYTASACTR